MIKLFLYSYGQCRIHILKRYIFYQKDDVKSPRYFRKKIIKEACLMEKITDEMIQEINELAHKSKTVGLNDEEKQRQQKLRQDYIRIFRQGFKQQLQHVKVVDAKGNDVTPYKKKN